MLFRSLYHAKLNKTSSSDFDFVINATYANLNDLTSWLSLPKKNIRIDLVEVVVITLAKDPISLTIIDGPFATLIPTGNRHEFTLYHVTESILDRYVPENGRVRKTKKITSNREKILSESMKYFPMLKDAVITESRFVHRAVHANREHDDSRAVDLIDHGFGCFSILSGKILTSVSTAKKISEIIQQSIEKNP